MEKFFDALKEGLEEAIEYEKKEKKTLRSRLVELPQPPKNYSAKSIKRIRTKLDCSQAVFARFLNISVKTVQAWEAGKRSPNHAALRLLELIDQGIYIPKTIDTQRKSQSKNRKVSYLH